MRNYEGMFIIDPDLQSDASKGVVTQIQEMVSKNGGRVDSLQDWGKKRLAYPINKKNDGQYVLMNFQLESKDTHKMEQALKLNENIVRYMIINKDDK